MEEEQKIEYDDIHYINDILKNNVKGLKLSQLNIDPMIKEYYTINRYLNNPLKKISMVYNLDETFEIGEILKKHKITDVSAFLLEKLREL